MEWTVFMKHCLLLFLLAVSVAHTHPIPEFAGTFSDLKYSEAEGDITGLEVTIIPSDHDGNYTYDAVVQVAEGVPATPQLSPVTVEGRTISFHFQYPGAGPVTFKGTISKAALTGNLTGAQFSPADYSLPRKVSFWQSGK